MSSNIKFYDPTFFTHEEMMKVTRSRLSRIISNICHRIWPDIRLVHFEAYKSYEYAAFCNEAGVPACWVSWAEGDDENYKLGYFDGTDNFNNETNIWSRSTNPQYIINVINKKFAERNNKSFADQVRTHTLDSWKKLLASIINYSTFHRSEGFYKSSPAEAIILTPEEMWHYMNHNNTFPTSAVEKFSAWENERNRNSQGYLDNYKRLYSGLGQEKWFILRKKRNVIGSDDSLWMVGSIQFTITFVYGDDDFSRFGVAVVNEADKITTPVMPKLYKNFCDIPQEIQAKLAMLEPYFEARGIQPLKGNDIDGYFPSLHNTGKNKIYDDVGLFDIDLSSSGGGHVLLIDK